MELVDRCTNFDELTTPMLNEFVSRIVVYERVKTARHPGTQRVDVIFNFIGQVELPVSQTEPPEETAPARLFVADNSAFLPLEAYLRTQPGPRVTLGFEQIEAILGRPLCRSARRYASYWYPGERKTVSNAIHNAGFDVEKADLAGESVTLLAAPERE